MLMGILGLKGKIRINRAKPIFKSIVLIITCLIFLAIDFFSVIIGILY